MEKTLEAALIRLIQQQHGWCLKLWSVSFTGLPDRIVLLPGAKIRFVEVKSEGKKPNKRQAWVHNKLRSFGFKVYWIDTNDKLKTFIDEL